MAKKNQNINVLEATQDIIAKAFKRSGNIICRISGDVSDSVLFDICYRYAAEQKCLDKLSLFYIDYEIEYNEITNYVTELFDEAYPNIKKYWLCLPLKVESAYLMKGKNWHPWNKENEAIWVRKLPEGENVISENNCPFKIKKNATEDELQTAFIKWFESENGTVEIINDSEQANDLMCAWKPEDLWAYVAQNRISYSALYDIFYEAGLPLSEMNVSNPFYSGTQNLEFYKALNPDDWTVAIGRINGASFSTEYGTLNQKKWCELKIPAGYTWKEFYEYLLSLLPEDTKECYERFAAASYRYWCQGGANVSAEMIEEIKALKLKYEDCGTSARYKNLTTIKFAEYPDEFNTTNFTKLPSYKRLCACIFRGDKYGTDIGFSRPVQIAAKHQKWLKMGIM